jgi:hypothetical protein
MYGLRDAFELPAEASRWAYACMHGEELAISATNVIGAKLHPKYFRFGARKAFAQNGTSASDSRATSSWVWLQPWSESHREVLAAPVQ